ELLLVLEKPWLPLHNNLSESDIREYVKKGKLSGRFSSNTACPGPLTLPKRRIVVLDHRRR
ncbi:MAG: hypothetical protein WA970_26310, partial [Gammaproteobacteria bacterium]